MGQRLKRKKLLVALGISVILTVASLAIIRPLKDPNACYVTLCHNGTATIALQRGFPLTADAGIALLSTSSNPTTFISEICQVPSGSTLSTKATWPRPLSTLECTA